MSSSNEWNQLGLGEVSRKRGGAHALHPELNESRFPCMLPMMQSQQQQQQQQQQRQLQHQPVNKRFKREATAERLGSSNLIFHNSNEMPVVASAPAGLAGNNPFDNPNAGIPQASLERLRALQSRSSLNRQSTNPRFMDQFGPLPSKEPRFSFTAATPANTENRIDRNNSISRAGGGSGNFGSNDLSLYLNRSRPSFPSTALSSASSAPDQLLASAGARPYSGDSQLISPNSLATQASLSLRNSLLLQAAGVSSVPPRSTTSNLNGLPVSGLAATPAGSTGTSSWAPTTGNTWRDFLIAQSLSSGKMSLCHKGPDTTSAQDITLHRNILQHPGVAQSLPSKISKQDSQAILQNLCGPPSNPGLARSLTGAPKAASGAAAPGGVQLFCLPIRLSLPEDERRLAEQQVFLRQQIEAFKADEDDVGTHTRGRNKPIVLGQVGIRCRHCAHLPVVKRQKGSTYFPATLLGLYQAAQNMSTTHMMSGLCSAMPEDVKATFASFSQGAGKTAGSGAGRPYWANAAKKLGLVDTEDGIRCLRDVPVSEWNLGKTS